MIFINMLTHWWKNFCDLMRYGDSQPSELLVGLCHSALVPLMLDDYGHVASWMPWLVAFMGTLQCYHSVAGDLIKRHIVNVAVALMTATIAVSAMWHSGVAQSHCHIIITVVALWNFYRTNYEVSNSTRSKWTK